MKLSFNDITKPIKDFFSRKKRIVCAFIVAVLLLISLITGCISSSIIKTLSDQLASDRWSDGRKMAQASIFFTEDRMITEEDIKRLEYELTNKLDEAGAGITADESDEEEGQDSLLKSCFSAQGTVTMAFENRVVSDGNAIGVYGDFFLFHPLILVSGSYFGPEDIMQDRVIIDENMAWELFGSVDIVGQSVIIGGVPHYISGVAKVKRDRISKAAGLSKSYIYMSYDSLCRYGHILSGRTESRDRSEDGSTIYSGGINCYEVVAPSPVDGIIVKSLKEVSGLDERYISVVDNSRRFYFLNLYKVAGALGLRSMWDKPIFYPYWENVARGYEDILAILLIIKTICLATSFVILCALAVDAYKNKRWTVKEIAEMIADKKYEFESNRHRTKIEEGEK